MDIGQAGSGANVFSLIFDVVSASSLDSATAFLIGASDDTPFSSDEQI